MLPMSNNFVNLINFLIFPIKNSPLTQFLHHIFSPSINFIIFIPEKLSFASSCLYHSIFNNLMPVKNWSTWRFIKLHVKKYLRGLNRYRWKFDWKFSHDFHQFLMHDGLKVGNFWWIEGKFIIYLKKFIILWWKLADNFKNSTLLKGWELMFRVLNFKTTLSSIFD